MAIEGMDLETFPSFLNWQRTKRRIRKVISWLGNKTYWREREQHKEMKQMMKEDATDHFSRLREKQTLMLLNTMSQALNQLWLETIKEFTSLTNRCYWCFSTENILVYQISDEDSARIMEAYYKILEICSYIYKKSFLSFSVWRAEISELNEVLLPSQ